MKWSFLILFVFASFVNAQPPQAPRPPQGPPVQEIAKASLEVGTAIKPSAAAKQKQNQLLQDATAAGRVFIVYVNARSRNLPGANSYHADAYEDDDTPRVCIRFGSKAIDVVPDSTDEGILRRINEMKGVSRAAVPFVQPSSKDARQTADDSPWLSRAEQRRLERLWPASLPFPAGMKFYRPTEWGQYAAYNGGPYVTAFRNDRDQQFDGGRQSPALNPNKLPHWRSPGGLDHLPKSEWQSYTAAVIPGFVTSWRGAATVRNAPNGWLPKEAWLWPDGTLFADMLCNGKGEVFEVRMREKTDGEWDSMTPFKDIAARPVGYHGAGKRCAECHDKKSGEESQYFISLRKQDGNFSASPLKAGTLEPDYANWPLERK